AAFAFPETNTRPVVVAAYNVLAFDVPRATQLTFPPLRVLPYGQVGVAGAALEHVSLPEAPGVPSCTQSPQTVPGANAPVNSLQFESRYACWPPSSSVRQTCVRPAYIVPCTTGSVMIGK